MMFNLWLNSENKKNMYIEEKWRNLKIFVPKNKNNEEEEHDQMKERKTEYKI